jgi:hypothetical protein
MLKKVFRTLENKVGCNQSMSMHRKVLAMSFWFPSDHIFLILSGTEMDIVGFLGN